MKIGILGADGRMGRVVVAELETGLHGARLGAAVDVDHDKAAAFQRCDGMIDFTSPRAVAEHADLAVTYKKPLVVGTTGLTAAGEAALFAASKKIAVFQAANMSVGVNLLVALVKQAAATLGKEFDIEIFEAHHKHKIDAPSGTALALGQAAAAGRGADLENVMSLDRAGKRNDGDIGFSVFRGGDVVGEHTVTFAGTGERIDLSHKATDRAIFARGAIRAAVWLKDKPAGFYAMRDMLGF